MEILFASLLYDQPSTRTGRSDRAAFQKCRLSQNLGRLIMQCALVATSSPGLLLSFNERAASASARVAPPAIGLTKTRLVAWSETRLCSGTVTAPTMAAVTSTTKKAVTVVPRRPASFQPT